MNSKGVFVRNYNKTNAEGKSSTVFVYAIIGTAAEREHYVEAVKKQVNQTTGAPVEPRFENDDPNGRPLFFTTQFAGNSIDIGYRREEGTPFLDNSKMAKASSLVNQLGDTVLGRAVAQGAAADILASAGFGPKASTAPVPAAQSVAQATEITEPAAAGGADPDGL